MEVLFKPIASRRIHYMDLYNDDVPLVEDFLWSHQANDKRFLADGIPVNYLFFIRVVIMEVLLYAYRKNMSALEKF